MVGRDDEVDVGTMAWEVGDGWTRGNEDEFTLLAVTVRIPAGKLVMTEVVCLSKDTVDRLLGKEREDSPTSREWSAEKVFTD